MVRRDELKAVAHLLLGRPPLEEQFVEIADAVFVGLLLLEFLSLDDVAHLLDDERAVHEEERLLRHGGFVAFAGRHIGAGKVERVQHLDEVGAVNVTVDRPARRRGQLELAVTIQESGVAFLRFVRAFG